MTENIEKLVAEITSGDEKRRTDAWLNAYRLGPAAIHGLVTLLASEDIMVRHAAAQGLRRLARLAGRPGADDSRQAVEKRMTGLLRGGLPAAAKREIIWILSEIGGDASVDVIADALADPEVREDARMALERIPGMASLAALKAALEPGPDEFKAGIEYSLQKRKTETPS